MLIEPMGLSTPPGILLPTFNTVNSALLISLFALAARKLRATLYA